MKINLTRFSRNNLFLYIPMNPTFSPLQTEVTHWWRRRSLVCSASWWWRSRSPRSPCGEWPRRWSAAWLLQQVRRPWGRRSLDVRMLTQHRYAASCAVSTPCLGCGHSRDTAHLEGGGRRAERLTQLSNGHRVQPLLVIHILGTDGKKTLFVYWSCVWPRISFFIDKFSIYHKKKLRGWEVHAVPVHRLCVLLKLPILIWWQRTVQHVLPSLLKETQKAR